MWRKAITASTTFCQLRSSSAPPVRKDDMAPATAAVELLPGALRLGEAVGDGVDDRRMMAEAAVAAIDLDVLGLGAVSVQASLPGADAVGAAEDGGRRHGRRLDQRIDQIVVFDLAAARDLIGAPGVGRFGRAGERTAQTDQAAHPVGYHLGELAGIEAAQAPADEADPAPAVALEQLVDPRQHVALEVGAQAEVASLVPAMRLIAVRIEKTAQSVGAAVVREQAGQHEDGMTIPRRHDGGEPRAHQPERAEFRHDTYFEQPERGRRGRKRHLDGAHRVAPCYLPTRVLCAARTNCSIVRRLIRIPCWYQEPISWFAETAAFVAHPAGGALADRIGGLRTQSEGVRFRPQ